MNNLVTVNLFGELGEYLKSDKWELNVKSVQEALKGLNTITNNKFNEFFIKNNKLNAKYRILINGRDFISPYNEINEKNWNVINESELVIKKNNLKTIDIVPLIESSSPHILGAITAILGVILIVIGILVAVGTIGGGGLLAGGLIVAGLALLGAGVVALLSRPPPFNFSQDLGTSVSQSYLFNGPINTVGEGNPIPVGYGTMLCGSNVISAGYVVTEFQTDGT